MKKTLKFTALSAVLLMLAGVMVSCNRDIDEKYSNVPFWICPSDDGYIKSLEVEGYALLFNDSISEDIKTKINQQVETLFQGAGVLSYVAYIVYEGNNIATLRLITRSDIGTYFICNFPDFAKEWGESPTGQKIFFRGKAFLLGSFTSFPAISGYDLGLTLLKKK